MQALGQPQIGCQIGGVEANGLSLAELLIKNIPQLCA